MFGKQRSGSNDLIPKAVLFGNPQQLLPLISPDGSKIAYLAPWEGVMNIWAMNFDGSEVREVTRDRKRGIRSYFWSLNGRNLYYSQDTEGRENWRLYSVDLNTGSISQAGLEAGEAKFLETKHDLQVLVARQSHLYPDTLLLALNKDNPQLFDIYEFNTSSGKIRMVARNPGNYSSWLVDNELQVRAGMAANQDGSFDLMLRANNEAEWEKYLTWSAEDALTSTPIGFSASGNQLLVLDSRNSNTAQLVGLDLSTKEKMVIAGDEKYDVARVLIDPQLNKVLAVSYYKDRVDWVIKDDTVEQDFKNIRMLDRGDFDVFSMSLDSKLWMVAFVRDDGPAAFYSYDRRKKVGNFLFESKPELNRYKLAKMEPFSFNARDGLEVHGYISFPVGHERSSLPMVLVVHGGPWSRHTWGFDPTAQWLTNRGYICLEVNFRGSTGYGKGFLNAGNKEWGRKMQFDLEDGVLWAIDKGYVDPERIAIFGASYGGYAALMGAATRAGLFRCAIDAYGPTNLVSFLENVPAYWETARATFYNRIGHPDKDYKMLCARSPLNSKDNIKIPLLIAQGANDVRVLRSESDTLVKALRERGVECEYLLFENEGHGFLRAENRMKFYTKAEQFLSKHLGGMVEN